MVLVVNMGEIQIDFIETLEGKIDRLRLVKGGERERDGWHAWVGILIVIGSEGMGKDATGKESEVKHSGPTHGNSLVCFN